MNKLRRWIGIGAGVLALLLLIGAGSVYAISAIRLGRSYTLPETTLFIPTDAASIERGRHLVVAITKCADCHGENLGGKVVVDDPALGRLAGPNLTRGRGGLGATLTPSQWDHAIRHGVSHDGRGLLLMPSEDYYPLSNEDLATMIAYIQQVSPVDNEVPPTYLGPVGRVLMLTGQFPSPSAERLDHNTPRTMTSQPSLTVEYGHYLALTGGCAGCHNPSFSGGPIPGAPPEFPPAANSTQKGLKGWSEEDFFRALREGKRPDGSDIDPTMPWKATREMTDDEIRALWMYLQTVPPRDYTQR